MKLTVGHTIRIIRMPQMKQGELEKKLGFSQGKLSRIEVHNEDFGILKLEQICKELRTSMVEFFKIKEGL